MQLTEEQVRRFREEGYLVAEGVITDEDLAPVIAEYEAWIDDRAKQLLAEGKITDLAEGAEFDTRFARLYAQSPEIGKGLDIMEARGPANERRGTAGRTGPSAQGRAAGPERAGDLPVVRRCRQGSSR